MRGRLRAALALVLLAQAAPRVLAQEPASPLTVEVITWGQGEAVWERFGHNAIRIRDARTGSDLAYNWGMFDFNQPNFLGRFLTGDTKYWMEPTPTALMIQFYQGLGRPATIQRLTLAPAQAQALQQFV